jgi:hypothetical protein
MKRLDNLYDVTKRLCGMIEPTGESNTDITRLENLEDTIDLVEMLTKDIVYVARNQNAYENSVKVIGLRADRFITEMREEMTAQPTFTENQIQQLQSKIHEITGDGKVMMLFNELLGISAGS